MKFTAAFAFVISVAAAQDARIAALEQQVSALRESLHDLSVSTGAQISNLVVRQKPAYLDFAHPDLSTATTDTGLVFYISPTDREQTDIGVRLRFSIGNPYAVSFANTHGYFTYGPRKPLGSIALASMTGDKEAFSPANFVAAHKKDQADEVAWRKLLKSHSTPMEVALKSGSWNDVSVIIPKTVIADVAYVELRFDTFSVSMSPPNP